MSARADETTTAEARLPVLLVGLRRPEGAAVDFPDGAVSTRRMERLLGVVRGRLRQAVDAVNLLGPHDEESRERLRTAAGLVDLAGREVVILCGFEVQAAFGFEGHGLVHTAPAPAVRGVTAAIIPHPSGRCWTWNSATATAKIRAALLALVAPHLPAGCLVSGSKEAHAALAAAVAARTWREEYLRELAKLGVKRIAASVAGVSAWMPYRLRQRDPEFAAAEAEAVETCIDRAEVEVLRRGVHGTVRPVYQGGRHVGDVREYSDGLLLAFLARHRPEQWAQRQRATIANPDGSPLSFAQIVEMAGAWRTEK